jgi:hypothetical protein
LSQFPLGLRVYLAWVFQGAGERVMKMRKMRLVAALVVLSGCANPAWAQLVSPKTKGTLTIDYRYQSSGQEADEQGNDHRDWRVSRQVSISALMVAENHSPVAALLQGTAAEKNDLAARQKQIATGAQKVAPMMAEIESIMQKCGDDEACMERESTNLAGTMDEKAIRSAGEDAAAAGRPMNNNYQLWRVSTYSGRYTADELYNASLADPDCMPSMRCVSQTVRKGSGAIPVNSTPLAVMMEVDGPGKRLHISLPMASGNMPVTRTVTGKVRDGKTGTFTDQFGFPWTSVKPVVVSLPNGLNNASGTQSVKIAGERGEGGTLTIEWRFVQAK